jgi:hypothetical protein
MDIVVAMVDASDTAGKHDVAALTVTAVTTRVYALTARSAVSAVFPQSGVSYASDLSKMPIGSAKVDSY